MVEHTLYMLLCLISPYIYAWFLVFGAPSSDSALYNLSIILELFFFFNIVFSFFVEYQEDGKMQPVRDLRLIAQRYLKGNFLIEFISVIPLQFLPIHGQQNYYYILKLIRIAIGLHHMDANKLYNLLMVYNHKRIN